jgi:hypothetical protein
MPIEISGGCLCGAVRYEGTTEPVVQGHCQCRDCQRATGAGHNTIMAVPEADITITGDLRYFDKPADSGNIVSRGFCPTCGSSVLSKNAAMTGMLFLLAGCLDDPGVLEPMMAVFTSRGNDWDRLDPALMSFPEMPPRVPGQG